jgi:hypothetical protein
LGKAIETWRPGKLEKPHEEGIEGGEIEFFPFWRSVHSLYAGVSLPA